MNQKNKNIKAIILAAGVGNRMGELTRETPKPLLKVNGKSLIRYGIDFVKKIGIEDITIVGGYLFDQLNDKVKSIDSSIVVVNNPDYLCQNLTSFENGLSVVGNESILTCDADYIFSGNTAKAISGAMNELCIYCSYDLSCGTEDVMKVKVDQNENMVEMSKGLSDFDCVYTGIFFIPKQNISTVKDIVAHNLNTNKKEARVESIFEGLTKKNIPIKIVDIGKADWFEFDTPEDLEFAQKEIKK